MNDQPLNHQELAFVDEMLIKYGNDDAVLDISELDGFLTAIVSGPDPISPDRWLPALWGGPGNEPEWQEEGELRRFVALVIQQMNYNITSLMDHPETFTALFGQREHHGETLFIAEEWCFGYMRGVQLADWPELPEGPAGELAAIALHGTEEGFDMLDTLTLEQHQTSVKAIEPAARALHAWWLSQRHPLIDTSDTAPTIKPDHDAPCPCGSGKPYKQCCLH